MEKKANIVLVCVIALIIFLVVVYKHKSFERNGKLPLSEEELVQRQKEEFVNALGYNDNERHKRDAGGTSPFDLIAGVSGGSVVHTGKDNISSAIDLLTTRMVNQVVILRQQLRVRNTTRFSFHVDESVTGLAVKTTTSCCKPNIQIHDPAGSLFDKSSTENVTVKVDTSTTLYFLINGTILTGTWTAVITDSNIQDYDVTIYGSSLIGYNLDFCDSMGNIVSGQPISERNDTYVKISPNGMDLTSNWTYFIIKTLNGTVVQRLPFGELKGSRRKKVFLIQVRWPNVDVHVAVQGLDKSGNIFTRELVRLIQPLGIRLHLDNTDIGYITSCNTPTSLQFTVTNLLTTDEKVTCQVTSSNPKFITAVKPSDFRLKSSMVTTVTASITLTSTPSIGESTDILITAMTSTKKAQYVTKTYVARNVTCNTIPVVHGTNSTHGGYAIITTGSALAITTSSSANVLFTPPTCLVFLVVFIIVHLKQQH